MNRDRDVRDPLFDREAWREFEHNRVERDFDMGSFFDRYDASQALSEFDMGEWDDAA